MERLEISSVTYLKKGKSKHNLLESPPNSFHVNTTTCIVFHPRIVLREIWFAVRGGEIVQSFHRWKKNINFS